MNFLRSYNNNPTTNNPANNQSLFHKQDINRQSITDIRTKYEKQIEFFMIYKCFDVCVESFMEKLLSPFEKECMNHCLQNQKGFYIETHNAFYK